MQERATTCDIDCSNKEINTLCNICQSLKDVTLYKDKLTSVIIGGLFRIENGIYSSLFQSQHMTLIQVATPK